MKQENSPGTAQCLSWDIKARVHPKNKQQAGSAQVPLCFVLPSLFCAGSSCVSGFHFCKIVSVLPILSTVWFLLHHKPSFSSGFLPFPAGTQHNWCVPHTRVILLTACLHLDFSTPKRQQNPQGEASKAIGSLSFLGATDLAHLDINHKSWRRNS